MQEQMRSSAEKTNVQSKATQEVRDEAKRNNRKKASEDV